LAAAFESVAVQQKVVDGIAFGQAARLCPVVAPVGAGGVALRVGEGDERGGGGAEQLVDGPADRGGGFLVEFGGAVGLGALGVGAVVLDDGFVEVAGGRQALDVFLLRLRLDDQVGTRGVFQAARVGFALERVHRATPREQGGQGRQ